MQAVKSIGSFFLGITIFIGIIIVIALVFTLGAKLAFTIQPFINWVAGILFTLNIVVLILAVIPKVRGVSGLIMFFSSYVFGLSMWIYGLAVTLALWGWIAVIIGLLLGGIGVVPIGMVAALFHAEWSLFWTLIACAVLTYGARFIGMMLITSAENQETYVRETDDVIDVDPIEAPAQHKRTWEDVE